MREPEPQVIEAARAGDRAAFITLVHLYQDPVWRFLTRLLGDRSLAEDVTQETMVRVHRGLEGFEGRSRFSTWVFGIARNAGLDAIRYRSRRPATVGPVPEWVPAPDRSHLGTELDLALATLADHHREALLLVEVLGLSYREVALLLEVAEGTVKSRVHHARRLLHEWMAADVETPATGARPSGRELLGQRELGKGQ